MSNKEYNQTVSNWMEQIENNCMTNAVFALECCEKLEQYAYEVDSDSLRGYCLFYKGFSYYTLYKLDTSYECLLLSIKFLSQTDQWKLVVRAYNALGNITHFQGEMSQSIDYFFTGLRLCREHELYSQVYSIQSNIANVFIALGEYEKALTTLKSCEEMIHSDPHFPPDSRIIIYINLASCYIRLVQLENALSYIKRTEELAEDNSLDRISLLLLYADFYNVQGDFEKRDETIQALQNSDFSYVVFDLLNEICAYARMLVEIGRYDVAEELFEIIEEQADTLYGQETLSILKLEYYKKVGAQQKYLEETARYFEISTQRRHQRYQIATHNIMVRGALEEEVAMRAESELNNSILRERSERDALTGISNRYKLNEVAETAFQKAFMNGTLLAVEILDIDCYKEYNDNYGHQAGDDCLIQLADTLRFLEEYDGIHIGRYGGDEFMIIYENYEKEDVLNIAETIRHKIIDLDIEHKYSHVAPHVTVSQGIFHKIPSGGNKLWDFTYCADLALYAVKHKGRNSCYLAGSLPEIKEYTGADVFPG